jgi:hypothetical protein
VNGARDYQVNKNIDISKNTHAAPHTYPIKCRKRSFPATLPGDMQDIKTHLQQKPYQNNGRLYNMNYIIND